VTTGDPSAGTGGGPGAVPVDPSSGEPVPTDASDGETALPIGVPVDADQLLELKRRADLPDPSPAQDATTAEDPRSSDR
jgi:hypothetical protein